MGGAIHNRQPYFAEIVQSGKLEDTAYCAPGSKDKRREECVVDNARVFGLRRDWRAATVEP